MNGRYFAWVARIDARSARERLMILCAVLGLVALLWDSLLMTPLERRFRQQAGQIAELTREIGPINSAIEEAGKLGGVNPAEQTRKTLDLTRAAIQALDQQLQGLTADLIDPREMSKVLAEVLTRNGGLKLVALKNLEATPLGGGGAEPSKGEQVARIYRHGLVIELTGTYLDTLKYLKALEQLRWRFFWDRVELSVETWPATRVTLVAYTLSLQEGVIGV